MNYKPDLNLLKSFTSEEYSQLESIFNSFDNNKDGFLEKNEILKIIHTLGFTDIEEENVDEFLYFLFSFSYTNTKLENNSNVSFNDFLNVMKEMKIRDGSLQLSNFFKDIEKAKIQANNEVITKNPELTVYTKIINDFLSNESSCQKYLPIDPNSDEIFDKIQDGILLCALINKIKDNIIDERVINKNENMTVFHQIQNINMAISCSKRIGIKCNEITSEIIMQKGDLSKILNYIGEICKFLLFKNISLKYKPELIQLLESNEQISSLLKLSSEDILLKWFNYHLKAAGYGKKIESFYKNFAEEIKDLEKYIILLNQLNNNEFFDKNKLNETDIQKRAEIIISKTNNKYITPDDLISGNVKLNILFIASIFNSQTGLKPPESKQLKEINNILSDENAEEENIYRTWINSLDLKNDNGEEIHINNLYEESKDGLLFLRILDKIKPKIVNWKKVDKKVKNVFNKLINCNEVIDACKKIFKDDVKYIGGSDIRDGKKKYILAIAFQLMKAYSLKIIGDKTEKELIEWGNSKVNDTNLKIKSLNEKKLSNSLYFIEIMNSIDSRIVNFDIIIKDKDDQESKENNAKNCISFALKLGAIVFLDWKDIIHVKKNLLLTFLASLYELNTNYVKKELE